MDRPTTLSLAEQYVSRMNFSGVPTHSHKHLMAPPPAFIPDASKHQSLVVGAQIQSFASGIDASTRQAIMNSILLAQLAAQKATVSSPDDYVTWYAQYFDALGNIGWLIQQKNFVSFPVSASTVSVHEAVLQLAAALMGGTGVTGYLIVQKTLDALQKLKDDSPVITIFDRQSRSQKAGSFQVSVATQDAAGGISISLMAFRLQATRTETKVIFISFKQYDVTLDYCSGTVGINKSVLEGIADKIEKKVADHVEGYVRMIEI